MLVVVAIVITLKIRHPLQRFPESSLLTQTFLRDGFHEPIRTDGSAQDFHPFLFQTSGPKSEISTGCTLPLFQTRVLPAFNSILGHVH